MTDAIKENLDKSKEVVCTHEDVAWGPIQIDYAGDGTAEVWQTGICSCDKTVVLSYIPGMLR